MFILKDLKFINVLCYRNNTHVGSWVLFLFLIQTADVVTTTRVISARAHATATYRDPVEAPKEPGSNRIDSFLKLLIPGNKLPTFNERKCRLLLQYHPESNRIIFCCEEKVNSTALVLTTK